KRLQPKNNQLIPRHYDPAHIDQGGMPPEDCPHWFLSQEALDRLGIEKVEFDADFDSDEEDPRKVRRAKLKRIGRSNADDEQEKSKGADNEQEKSKGEKAKDLAEITPEELVALINKKTILPKVFVNPNEVLLNPLSS